MTPAYIAFITGGLMFLLLGAPDVDDSGNTMPLPRACPVQVRPTQQSLWLGN